MIDNVIINTSSTKIKPAICKAAPSWNASAKAVLLNLISNNRSGRIIGKPNIGISAAFCCALAAMALIKVKTKLKLILPINTIPVNLRTYTTGLFRNMKNNNKLNVLMIEISKLLKICFAMINSTGEAML